MKLLTNVQNSLALAKVLSSAVMSDKRVSELRTLYGLKCKMPENVYLNQYDRIRGYMIRNTKFMSGRRNIYFDLKYTDFETLPTK